MIIDNFHVFGISANPTKTYAPLVINADAVLTLAVASELLESVCWWNSKIEQASGSIEYEKFAQCHPLKIGWKLSNPFTFEEALSLAIAKTTNHAQ